MADWQVHDNLIVWATPFATAFGSWGATQLDLSEWWGMWVGAWHVFGGLCLSPDLDIRSRPLKRWGIFKVFWYPYRDFFKHRGVSHWLFVGSLTRLGYLLITPVFFYAGLVGFQEVLAQAIEHWRVIVGVYVGVEVSAIVHYIADLL